MYPAPFEYVRASSWEEAVRLLEAHGDEAKVLAGGQSLIPMMSLRLVKPRYVVDVGRAADRDIRQTNSVVEVSALARHIDLERAALLATHCPIVSEAAAHIGNIRVRHRGTIGGSLAHADPAAELPCVVVALGARIRVLGPRGERAIPADALFETYFTTSLEPTEVIVAVELPCLPPRRGWAFLELARRVGDFALLEVAALLDLAPEEDRCTGVRLVLGAVADRPVDLSESAQVLVGASYGDRLLDEAARAVAASVHPREDHRASASYRREMVAVLARRALRLAWERARLR
jgi:carbon-monoxide dehydrogenase medium subunit